MMSVGGSVSVSLVFQVKLLSHECDGNDAKMRLDFRGVDEGRKNSARFLRHE